MQVAIPTNRKKTVPMLVATATRLLAWIKPQCTPSTATKKFMTSKPATR